MPLALADSRWGGDYYEERQVKSPLIGNFQQDFLALFMLMLRSRLQRGMDIQQLELHSGRSEQAPEDFSGIKFHSFVDEMYGEVSIYLRLRHQDSNRLRRAGKDGSFQQGTQQSGLKGGFEQPRKPLCAVFFATCIMKSAHPFSVSGKKVRPIILRQKPDTFMIAAFGGSS